MAGASGDEIADFFAQVCPGITVKFWYGVEYRDPTRQRQLVFGDTSPVLVVHNAGDWHWRLYCFDFEAEVKACIGGYPMPTALASYLDVTAAEYWDFKDISPSPQLPGQDADECAARVACFGKWFVSSRHAESWGFADGYATARFDQPQYLRSVQSRMEVWRQVRRTISSDGVVPKLLTQSSICRLCLYDRCPTSVMGLPQGLTNGNSLCFLNQALAVLATSGPWTANPNSLIGHLVVEVLKTSVSGGQTEDARTNLARALFQDGNLERTILEDDDLLPYSGGQQCLAECLQGLFEHISGPLVTRKFRYTCTLCNEVSQDQQSDPAIFSEVSPETAVMQLEAMLVMEQTESVHWRCSTLGCRGNAERPKPGALEDDTHKFALGASFMVGALPDTLIVVCKRRQFGWRLKVDIQIPLAVSVRTCDIHTLEETSELYSPIYVALHGSGSDDNSELRSARRSAFNVPDSVERSVAHANRGHYFGAALAGLPNGNGSDILYLDDDQVDKGHREELLVQGQKIVVVVLRKQTLLGAVNFFNIAERGFENTIFNKDLDLSELEESVKLFDSKNLLEEWSPKQQAVSHMCHRVANQVHMFLRDSDSAMPCFTEEQVANRREIVAQLFNEHETEQTRRIILTAIAILWEVRIIVHKFREQAESYGTTATGNLSLFFHNGVLYPTSLSTTDPCDTVKTAEGLLLGVLPTRRRSQAHRAVFDTIIPLVYPLVVSMYDAEPNHDTMCAIQRAPSKQTTVKLPRGRTSTYWFGRNLVQSVCGEESSLLARSSPNSTAIECSYAMIRHVVQCVERFVPFTHESAHLILGCGRRGPLLLHSMVDKDITVVGLDISAEAVLESRQLVAKLQATDAEYWPKIHAEETNVETLTSVDGFTSVSRFAGGKAAGTRDHASRNATDELVFRSPTVKVYWNNHLPDMNVLDLPAIIKAEWRVLVLPGTRQENCKFSTFLYFRVKPADSTANICLRVKGLISAAQRRTSHTLVAHETPTLRQSKRVSDKKENPSDRKRGPSAAGSPSTPGIEDTPKNPSKIVPATPTRRNNAKPGVTPPSPSLARVEPIIDPPTVGDTPPSRSQARTRRSKLGDADVMINQESATAAMFKETTRNLTAEFKHILTEVKKTNATLSEHRAETNKKAPSKIDFTELSKQLSSAGFKESAEILKQIPTLAAKLDAANEAINRLPDDLTSQMRKKTLAENAGTKAPQGEPSEVLAQLRATLSLIPTTISAALPPAGIQAGMHDVQKVLAELTVGMATNQRDLLWLETTRVAGLREQETALRAEAKRKKHEMKAEAQRKEHEKDMKRKKKKKDRKEKKKEKKQKKEKKRQKIAADEKEQNLAAKTMTEEEKNKLLSLLQNTGALRMHRSPSKAERREERKRDSETSSSSDNSERSRSRDRATGRRKSRSRDRSTGRRKSRSRDRSRDRSKSRPRDRSRGRKKSRSRDRSRGRDRDRRPRGRSTSVPLPVVPHPLPHPLPQSQSCEEAASVSDVGEEGVGMWLTKNHLADFRDIFKKNNVCGADLKYLTTTQLKEWGMQEHQLTRFLNLKTKM